MSSDVENHGSLKGWSGLREKSMVSGRDILCIIYSWYQTGSVRFLKYLFVLVWKIYKKQCNLVILNINSILIGKLETYLVIFSTYNHVTHIRSMESGFIIEHTVHYHLEDDFILWFLGVKLPSSKHITVLPKIWQCMYFSFSSSHFTLSTYWKSAGWLVLFFSNSLEPFATLKTLSNSINLLCEWFLKPSKLLIKFRSDDNRYYNLVTPRKKCSVFPFFVSESLPIHAYI